MRENFLVVIMISTFIYPKVSLAQNNQGVNFSGVDTATASGSAKQGSSDQAAGAALNGTLAGTMAVAGAYYKAEAATCAAAAATGCNPAPLEMQSTFYFIQAALGAAQALAQGLTSGANNDKSNTFRNGLNFPNGKNSPPNTNTTPPAVDPNNQDPDSNPLADDPDKGRLPDPDKTDTNTIAGLSPNSLDALKGLSPGAYEAIKKLGAAGYKIDPKTSSVTTPDGTTITPSDASNPSTLDSKLGLSPGTSARGMQAVQDIAKKYQADHGGLGGGSGDGSLAGAGSGADGYGAGDKEGPGGKYNPNKSGAKPGDVAGRLPASALVAGLTSKYNGENIGVAADNIFTMVQRRYQLKNEQDSFIITDQPNQKSFFNAPRN